MNARYERYAWSGGSEWLFAHGPADGPRLLIVPPLFEELNYTRATLVIMARRLAVNGIASWIMDLPGCGESEHTLDEVRWEDWRAAVAAAAHHIGDPLIAAIRGGCLLDDAAAARRWWRFAPADGAALLRQMERAQAIGDKESKRSAAPPDAPLRELIGYRLSLPLVTALREAKPAAVAGACRSIALEPPRIAPWRRAEPVADAALAADLSEDLTAWIAA